MNDLTQEEVLPKKKCIRAPGAMETSTVLVPNDKIGETDIEASGSEKTLRNKIIAGAIITMLEGSPSESDDNEEMAYSFKLRNKNNYGLDLALLLCQNNPRNSVKNYLDETVPSYTEEEFRTHFRISRTLFENLCERFSSSEFYKNMRPDRRLSDRAHLLVFLWFAGHEACSFRDLSDRFNYSLSTISKIISTTTMFISSLSPEIIKWPNQQQIEESSMIFDNKCMFSKAIGCIDGTHIKIVPPKRGKDEYIDRKGNVTLVLQGICNENKKFIDIFVGYPGSSHDSWVFKNSPVFEKLSSLGDYYLLGDSAYPCNQNLVTPYRDNGHLTRAQKVFNCRLSSGRVAIEHTYGILKQRFRQLYFCKLRGMEKLCHFVRACCVLHNISSEDDFDFYEEPISEEHHDHEIRHANSSRGNNVRDPICQTIQDRLNQIS